MTSDGKYGIFKRMAVLWEQRKLVFQLKKLTDIKLLERVNYMKNDGANDETVMKVVHENRGEVMIDEKDLLEKMCNAYVKKKEDNIRAIMKYKRILNSCIDDGYLKYEEMEGERRLVRITDDKAPELLNGLYFYLKYLPEIFPHPSNVTVAVLTALLSALFTSAAFFFIKKYLPL